MNRENTARTYELIDVERLGDTVVADIAPSRLTDLETVTRLRSELRQVAGEATHVVLGFKGLTFTSSAALGIFITLRKLVGENGGRMALYGLRPTVLEVFQITRLNHLFPIAQTRQEALEAVSDDDPGTPAA